LRKVCEDISRCEGLVVSVNISRLDITDPKFPEEVSGILADFGVHPTQVILECTDSITDDDISKASVTLSSLRQQGLAVAIYEMETGFTSFGFLEMPGFTLLKIEKVLLDEALQSAKSRENLQEAIDAGKAKGFKALAFGIENEVEADLAAEMGFDYQQGFFHSASLSLEELISFSGNFSEKRNLADV
jgi:EAL domain-containing protein (putative c-di-GMP-specific phosphodiesterase class I)